MTGADQEFRNSVIGASEIAVLYGLSPWLTRFQLWHEKAGTVPPREFATTEAQQAGVRLEAAIIDWACDKWGYVDNLKQPDRVEASSARIGGHPDRIVRRKPRSRDKVVLEVKTVDRMAYQRWENGEPPMQYQLQAMAYAAMTGCQEAHIIALVGGNQLERFVVEFRRTLWSDICDRVRAFWKSIDEAEEPDPDYYRDADAIAAVYGSLGIEEIDLSHEPKLRELAERYTIASEDRRAADKIVKAAQAEINHLIGLEAAQSERKVRTCIARAGNYTIRSTLVLGQPDRPAEPGEIIKGRKDYRRLTVKENESE